MFGKKPYVNALESRRQLLVAESELNRVQLLKEWQTMTEGVRSLADRAKSVGSLASAAALLVAGVSAFRRSKAMPTGVKPSWFHTILKGAQLAGSIWFAFRARSRRCLRQTNTDHGRGPDNSADRGQR
jgi:hypothetical protein